MTTPDVNESGPSGPGQRTSPFSPRILNIGFLCGLFLAIVCLGLSGWYLLAFEASSNAVINSALDSHAANAAQVQSVQLALTVHMYTARLLLLSCGIFVGMAFGFLGFSLFLIGAQGEIEATARGAGDISLSVARLSPGIFAILSSTILIGLCATRAIPANLAIGDSKAPILRGVDAGASSLGPDAHIPNPGGQ